MSKDIPIKDALNLSNPIFIDVRSESEFHEATLPGAVNIPLLRDGDRAKVGITYKHKGVVDAKNLGLELVSPRLPQITKAFQEQSQKGPIVVFCWRGGLRSQSICNFLDTMDVPVYRLIGGYKSYRRYVNTYLEGPLPHKTVVIHGLTGVGKTELLQELRALELPAIDLEGLASNRGSVFGQIGLEAQPSQKNFESLLAQELVSAQNQGYIIVECESRRIGRNILPSSLTNCMREGTKILAYCPIDIRRDRIIRIYTDNSRENKRALKSAVESLEGRLGKTRVTELGSLIEEGRLEEVVEFLLINYYDPLYKYPCHSSEDYQLNIDTSDVKAAAEHIKDFLKTQNFL